MIPKRKQGVSVRVQPEMQNHYLHPYSLPDYLPGGLTAPSDTVTASHM